MNIKEMDVDQLNEYLIECKKDLTEANKKVRTLKSKINNATVLVDKLSYVPDADRIRVNRLIGRDKDICISYIKKFGRVPTRELIQLLNKMLKGKETRWKGEIDSNLFMNYMGKFLQNEINIKNEKDMDPISKRVSTWWWIS